MNSFFWGYNSFIFGSNLIHLVFLIPVEKSKPSKFIIRSQLLVIRWEPIPAYVYPINSSHIRMHTLPSITMSLCSCHFSKFSQITFKIRFSVHICKEFLLPVIKRTCYKFPLRVKRFVLILWLFLYSLKILFF